MTSTDSAGAAAAAEAAADEFGLEEDASDSAATLSGVRSMIYLAHKDCLMTAHTDRIMRVWSTTKAEFLQRLDLLAPAPPPEEAAAAEAADASAPGDAAVSKAPAAAPGAARAAEGDRPSRRGSKEAADLVSGQRAAVTALNAEQTENRWLLTGDSEGYVRLWDLLDFEPHARSPARYLLRAGEFQPHRQAVTHLEHFELDGQSVVMSASVDMTIVLSTITGERIGTFGGKAPRWHLAEGRSAWCSTPPVLEEISQGPDEEEGWSVSPRWGGKGGGPVRRGAAGQAGGRDAAGMGGRRGGQAERMRGNTRPVAATLARGRGVFQQLSYVERYTFDFSLSDKEKQYLTSRQPVRNTDAPL
eukprot:TRINITY_DN22331_c0_g1_i1.p1 TRINITY_DN22331_c0_g1~~TRINITY_DN22331_c0_g1_i1.p1  ORF type:complete len:419 (+),score=101.11 TRINITY_DN22331_c0_g1_i1:183-1259(+)